MIHNINKIINIYKLIIIIYNYYTNIVHILLQLYTITFTIEYIEYN